MHALLPNLYPLEVIEFYQAETNIQAVQLLVPCSRLNETHTSRNPDYNTVAVDCNTVARIVSPRKYQQATLPKV